MEEIETKKVNIRSKAKRVACFTALFTAILLTCVGISALIWAGGWVKSITCDLVLEDSFIWDKMKCSFEEEAQPETGGVIEMDIPENIEDTEDIVTAIIEQASPATVTVAVNTLAFDYEKGYVDQEDGIGSGFVVDSSGLIVTNQHVVSDENEEYSVILPEEDEAIPVERVYRDNTNDIAVLKVDRANLTALKLGDSDELKRGNLVIAIGSPFGDLEGTATVGYVTGLDREVTAGSGFFGSVSHYEGVIQTDAAINPGNSGGPLLNSSGEVIGINFATTSGADNISFAIPVNQVKSRLEVFEEEGRFPQPYIGVSYSQRTIVLKDTVLTGAVVIQVEKEGPANKAGVEKGDIILEVNDKDLGEHSLAGLIQSSEVGEELKLEVWREGEIIELVVIVGDMGENE